MIELKGAHVVFNKGTKIENHVLKGIDFKVMYGQFVTIIGGSLISNTSGIKLARFYILLKSIIFLNLYPLIK